MTKGPAFDVIVIGAGIAGAAIAERLTAGGSRRRVLVLEKEKTWCTGTSARSAGGVRQQFGERQKIEAAMYAMRCFETFAEQYGVDPCLKKHGYLVLDKDEASAAQARRAIALQNEMGLRSVYLKPEEIAGVVPPLRTDDLVGAAYCVEDGYLDPHTLVQGFITAFLARGGVMRTEARVTGFARSGNRIVGVETARGREEAGAVVVAAGPFAGGLLAAAGVSLPLRPCRRQIFTTGMVAGVDPHWPLVLEPDWFYFRPETGGVIMSIAEVEEMAPPEQGNDIPVSRAGLPELARRATERCPLLAEAEVRSGWAGLRTLTPDGTPVLGAIPGVEGLFVAAGFSGYGVTLSPFTAEVVAAAVNGEAPRCGDPAYFSPARFMR